MALEMVDFREHCSGSPQTLDNIKKRGLLLFQHNTMSMREECFETNINIFTPHEEHPYENVKNRKNKRL